MKRQRTINVILVFSLPASAAKDYQRPLRLRGGTPIIVSSSATTTRNLASSICEDNSWHPDHIRPDGCSNSLDYPVEWERVDNMWFDNAEDCCKFFSRNGDCNVYNVCEENKPPTGGSADGCGLGWFPDIVNMDGCSNGKDYPLEWANKPHYFSDTSEGCCSTYFKGKDCKAHDNCDEGAPSSSVATNKCGSNQMGWFPDPTNQDGCSNGEDYPSDWTDKPEYFFKSPEDCCGKYFKGRDCKVYHNCEEEVSVLYITSPPSSQSQTSQPLTLSPTKLPSTLNPSKPPSSSPSTSPSTAAPTTAPTPEPIRYYQVFSTGICTPLDAFTPYWMTDADFYVDYAECCNNSFNKAGCLAVSPTSSPTTTSPTTQPTRNPSQNPTTLSPSSSPTANPSFSPSTAFPSSNPSIKPSTQNPSSKPTTLQPITAEPTQPPSCHSAPWHPNEDFSKCTNSFGYDINWDKLIDLRDTYLHASSEICCEKFFWHWGKECEIKDICASTSPTKKPIALAPTRSPVMSSPSLLEKPSDPCSNLLWHPNEDYSKCSNSLSYDNGWNFQPLKDTYLHVKMSDCCEVFFHVWNKDCVVEDTCTGVTKTIKSTTTTTTVVAAENSCGLNTWHPSTDFNSCSNSPNYPDSWNQMKDQYLHDSKEDCCKLFFHSHGKDCLIKESCSGTTFTIPASTASPSSSPTRKETCESRPWHPLTNFQECSNNEDHPESWNWPIMREQYMFDTKEDCCNHYFFVQGKDCIVQDTCSGTSITILPSKPTANPTTSPTGCESRPWHPLTSWKKCTNSLQVPPSWNLPEMKGQYMFDTQEECCEAFFFVQGKECEVEDACTNTMGTIELPADPPSSAPTPEATSSPTACNSRPWHPLTDFKSCSNNFDVPESWKLPSMKAQYMFDNKEDCCEAFFLAEGKNCQIIDSCSGVITVLKPPSESPSSRPTLYPTKSPTQEPTKSPMTSTPTSRAPTTMTSEPTSQAPTTSSPASSIKYFSSPSSSLCYAVDEDTPSWITTFFSDFTECCKVGWKFDECMAAISTVEGDREDDESTSTTTSTTSSSTTIMQYYSNPSNSMCANVDGNTPSWITTFFTDWEECCKVGWKFDECMAAAYSNSVGDDTEDEESATSTTSSTTIITDVKYYSSPSDGMCAIVDEKTPSWINTFFTDWEDCCKVGWLYSKCIEERPA